ncbi:uncharacterized protein G2W53_019600 [Senna tora]|uniref:Uncharacterized protein n=1 Tax=Senna tora TaxID=362788 RepID=A0A834TX93_9FABA|nr:uncharacterized protein G2W53_019600 [Senna tora]
MNFPEFHVNGAHYQRLGDVTSFALFSMRLITKLELSAPSSSIAFYGYAGYVSANCALRASSSGS